MNITTITFIFAHSFHQLNPKVKDNFGCTQKVYFFQILFTNLPKSALWALLLCQTNASTSQVSDYCTGVAQSRYFLRKFSDVSTTTIHMSKRTWWRDYCHLWQCVIMARTAIRFWLEVIGGAKPCRSCGSGGWLSWCGNQDRGIFFFQKLTRSTGRALCDWLSCRYISLISKEDVGLGCWMTSGKSRYSAEIWIILAGCWE